MNPKPLASKSILPKHSIVLTPNTKCLTVIGTQGSLLLYELLLHSLSLFVASATASSVYYKCTL
jgi:hypothetical protein